MAGSKPRKGQRKCAGSSGGRESGAAALAMVQVGSGALAVGGGGGDKERSPGATQEGHCWGPGAALLWDIPGQCRAGLVLGSKAGGGRPCRATGFRGRRQLETTDGPSWFCLAQARN